MAPKGTAFAHTHAGKRHIKNLFKHPISLVVRERWQTTRSYTIPHLTGQLVSKGHLRVAEMVHQGKALVAPAEDLGLGLRIHLVAHNQP